ncbi:DUF1345 domain-containing protein [Sphingopyxis macrogoltabida]|uniref:DUF1345 domain-containing protein n=1 Tax=Sphingopyxis macrogoltabida TaxID=33050 RepID=A0A0N9USR9_SPHMC|nr:DUF1345 domain-containing protein [Sphingopyxis macrogoltabida]ALH78865.1 hypothetical protein AN936_00275 [Sphingopyxis macrogoltabida]
MARTIGNRIAPPRFVAYAAGLVLVAAWAIMQDRSALQDFLIGFDIVTALFLLSTIPLFRTRDPHIIERHAVENDANRVALLVISVAVSAVVLGALAQLVSGTGQYSKPLVIVTLALAWLFANTVYAIHYAHLYYTPDKAHGGHAGGLSVPSSPAPDYFDFLHFALILGMTFQTADIDITSRAIRRVSTWHCLEAFIFNIGILAFSINMIAGS